jgi:hypothetical protein
MPSSGRSLGPGRSAEVTGRLERRAVGAASAVAAAYGIASDQAVVIHSASNVLVHLRPAPVIARVMPGTVALHDDPAKWLTREISVLEFPRLSRLPSAAPADQRPAGSDSTRELTALRRFVALQHPMRRATGRTRTGLRLPLS